MIEWIKKPGYEGQIPIGFRNTIFHWEYASVLWKYGPSPELDEEFWKQAAERCSLPQKELEDLKRAAEKQFFDAKQKHPEYEEPEQYAAIQDLVESLKWIQPENNKKYPLTERGAARLFADVFRKNLIYQVTAREWFCYDGKRWQKDESGMRAAQLAKRLSDAVIIYSTCIADDKQKAEFLKFWTQYARYDKRDKLVKDGRSDHYASPDDFDRNLSIFNMQNGEFNLDTGKLEKHNPDHLLTKVANVWYEKNAKSQVWDDFINEVMSSDREKAEYLQKGIGISLTGKPLDRMLSWVGRTTRNGKSTCAGAISHAFGDYALSMSPETLAQQKSIDTRRASGDIARLNGCRLVIASEPGKGMQIDAARLKSFIGHDKIVARNLCEREFEFTLICMFVLISNEPPWISDDSVFASNRISEISFDRHFTDEEQDPELLDKLKQPDIAAAIFNWAYEGLKKYRKAGFIPPESVKQATEAYRKENDRFSQFFDECMAKCEGNWSAGDCYKAYRKWCNENSYLPVSKRNFFEDLRKKGVFADQGTVGGVTVRNVVMNYSPITDYIL